jgi:splicing factor 3B subunit 3
MVEYKHESNKFIPFVDDTIARWTTSTAMVDYESVAGGDKYGKMSESFAVPRKPDKSSRKTRCH